MAACQAARASGLVLAGCRSDRVLGVRVAVPFPVAGDEAGAVLPVGPGGGVVRDWAEGAECPGWLRFGSVLAEPAGAVVHCCREFGHVLLQFGRAHVGHPVRPAAWGLWLHAFEQAAGPRIEDSGYVPCPVHASCLYGLPQDFAAVEAGGFGFPEGAPQPCAGRVVEGLLGEAGGQGAA